MTKTLHTFVVYVEDRPGVLNRVVSLFRRRGFNIESLSVGHTDLSGVSRMTIVMEADEGAARLVEANLYKLVNVLRVEGLNEGDAVLRDLALIKVRANTEQRAQVLQIVNVFRARVVDVVTDAMVVEITGSEDKIEGLVDVLRPFGIIEMARTGTIAMRRGAEAPSIQPQFVHAVVPDLNRVSD
ncbi:MAG: acetolactate synthase small subunit [Vicinamibacteria bacterium]